MFLLGIIFCLMAVILWLSVRDPLDPVFVYPAAWGVTLVAIGMAAPFGYFQIRPEAGLIFILAAAAFVIGTVMVPKPQSNHLEGTVSNIDYQRLALACAVLHVFMVPVSIVDMRSVASDAEDFLQLAFQLRIRSVTGEQSVGVITGNYITAGLVLVPIMMAGFITKKISGRLFIAVAAPWVFLGLLISGRVGVITISVTCFYIFVALGGRLSIKAVLAFFLLFAIFLIAGNLLVGKIEADITDDLAVIAVQSVKSFFDYLFAGPILFSRYMEDPTSIVPTWDALIFPCHILEKFGACTVPLIHQEFLPINIQGDLGNVYSVAFSIFPKYGFLGLVVVMFSYGLLASYFHRFRQKNIFHFLMAGFMFYATMLSIFTDGFGISMYFFIKVYIISVLVSYFFRPSDNLAASGDGYVWRGS